MAPINSSMEKKLMDLNRLVVAKVREREWGRLGIWGIWG